MTRYGGGRGQKPFHGRMRCPHPECVHIGEHITKVHCRLVHGMEREELFEKYGPPEPVPINAVARSQNLKIKTIHTNNKPTITGQKSGASRS